LGSGEVLGYNKWAGGNDQVNTTQVMDVSSNLRTLQRIDVNEEPAMQHPDEKCDKTFIANVHSSIQPKEEQSCSAISKSLMLSDNILGLSAVSQKRSSSKKRDREAVTEFPSSE
jgi:hypothetical protein